MKTIRRRLAVAAALVPAAMSVLVPATAQDKPAPVAKPDDIVVTARQDRDKQIGDFVRGMTPPSGTDPLARFDTERLCPFAVGLTGSFNKQIVARMRQVAAAAKVPLARESCRAPNALVIFADDKDAMMAMLQKRFPAMFLDDRGQQVKIRPQPGPAVAWHVNGVASSDGVRLFSSGGAYVLSTTNPGSRITASTRPIFVLSVVVIDIKALVGLSATQIADYAAMRTFTDADPVRAKESGAPTILTILEAPMNSETPVTLTAWDLGFMRGLYNAPADLGSSAQRGAIGRTMTREIDRPRADGSAK